MDGGGENNDPSLSVIFDTFAMPDDFVLNRDNIYSNLKAEAAWTYSVAKVGAMNSIITDDIFDCKNQ